MNSAMEYETALLVIPPPKVQSFAFSIRERYDTEWFNRVPAHITLLYPFVPSDQVETTAALLKTICVDLSPFELTLDKYGKFKDALFLEPSNPDPILELHQHLTKAFPDYPIYEGEHGDDLHPHMTLARFENPEEAEKIELPPTPTFTFIVNRLHLYLGSPEASEPYIPISVIPIGSED
jgi:2'-5' RNA ligase